MAAVVPAVAAAAALSLGLGINLGNTLEAPEEGQWAPAAQPAFFDAYKAAGFTTVRIPIRWDLHTGTAPPYAINASWLARVETVVGWSLARGFATIINTHHDDWLDNSTTFDAQLPRFKAIWTQVAAAFATAPTECAPGAACLLFEAFNEPHLMSVANLNAMTAAFYSIVRGTPGNEQRWALVGGLQWMNPAWIIANPDALVIPGGGADPRVALEVHSYDPFKFTSPPVSVFEWGSAADLAAMTELTAGMAAWSAAHGGIPVVLGEWACSHQQTNSSARLLWYRSFAEAVKAAGFAVAVIWDDDGDYQTLNRATMTWDEAVLQAIGL